MDGREALALFNSRSPSSCKIRFLTGKEEYSIDRIVFRVNNFDELGSGIRR
jgi:hypothetical protein